MNGFNNSIRKTLELQSWLSGVKGNTLFDRDPTCEQEGVVCIKRDIYGSDAAVIKGSEGDLKFHTELPVKA